MEVNQTPWLESQISGRTQDFTKQKLLQGKESGEVVLKNGTEIYFDIHC